MENWVKRGTSGKDNPVPSWGNGIEVPQTVYRLDGEQPSNNPSTSAQHPYGVKR
jgi:hypothetical protein